jgi:protein-S-isoprenylcysteine O-methyltransferase Ste14
VIRPLLAVHIAWAAWFTIWVAAARWSRRTVSRSPRRQNYRHMLVTVAGFYATLLWMPAPRSPLFTPLWRVTPAVGWILFALMVGSILFGCWARIELGDLWSGDVTHKEGHRIVETGPYAIVRHPIYTALIGAAIATAAIKASPLALAGPLLMAAGFWEKARLEERFLSAELGEDAYSSYRARVPMLMPFAPAGQVDRVRPG